MKVNRNITVEKPSRSLYVLSMFKHLPSYEHIHWVDCGYKMMMRFCSNIRFKKKREKREDSKIVLEVVQEDIRKNMFM